MKGTWSLNPKEVDRVHGQYCLHDVECVVHDVEWMMYEDTVRNIK